MYNRAENMLLYVPSYYQGSKLYHAQNDAKGAELDAIRWLIDDVETQVNPLTATWSLPLWEDLCGLVSTPSDSLGSRRDRIFTLLVSGSSMTARTIEAQVKSAFGLDVSFSWTREPYVVDMTITDFTENRDFGRVLNMVYELMPAHLALLMVVEFALTKWRTANQAKVSELLISGLRVNVFEYTDIFLDGHHVLDGSWKVGMFSAKGLDVNLLRMTLSVAESNPSTVSFILPVISSTCSQFYCAMLSLSMAHFNANRFSAKMYQVSVSSKTVSSNSIYLTEDSMWNLDGAFTLDGSRKMNANITRSEQ